MTPRGFDGPLYILPFDHRGSFETGMFGWHGTLDEEQTAQIAAAKQVIYDGFKAALAGGVKQDEAAILVDEQFGAAILRDAAARGYHFACPADLRNARRRERKMTNASIPAGMRANSASQLCAMLYANRTTKKSNV